MDVVGACGAINGLLDPCLRRMAAIRADLVMPCGGAALAASTPGPVEESDELYLLSAAGSNVKVRDGLMDIKLLREVDGDGLERWEPVLKVGFPLPAAEVVTVFDALGVPAPPLARDAYTVDQFLGELVDPTRAVRVVRVHKRRQRYTLANCMAEVAEL